jgi:predicted adenylyl cyclase CyaB
MPPAARNIELKARIADFTAAIVTARSLAAEPPQSVHQIDTYFNAAHGRLKLREVTGREAQLVWYSRSDQAEAKSSDYRLVPAADPAALKQALGAALGIKQVVEKQRLVFMYGNVRIHLDEVVGLGFFLEFEAVLGPGIDDSAGRAQVEFLKSAFRLRGEDLIAHSYSDLLAERNG